MAPTVRVGCSPAATAGTGAGSAFNRDDFHGQWWRREGPSCRILFAANPSIPSPDFLAVRGTIREAGGDPLERHCHSFDGAALAVGRGAWGPSRSLGACRPPGAWAGRVATLRAGAALPGKCGDIREGGHNPR